MFDVVSARIVLERTYTELEALSQAPVTEEGYLSVVSSLRAFQLNLDIDLNFDLETTLLSNGYETLVEALEDAALNDMVSMMPTDVTYESTLTQVRALQGLLDEADPVGEDAEEDLLDSYFELLQMVACLADRDVVDVWTVFEVF